jgi:hypothetical protein
VDSVVIHEEDVAMGASIEGWEFGVSAGFAGAKREDVACAVTRCCDDDGLDDSKSRVFDA